MDNYILNGACCNKHILELECTNFVDIAYLREILKDQTAISPYDLVYYLNDKKIVSIRYDNDIIGYIFLYKPMYCKLALKDDDFLIDYVIHSKYRNKGIGTKSLYLLLKSNLKEIFDVNRIVAVIADSNIPSIKCALANNMRKFRNFYIKELQINEP